jgi:hypothetical protein
MTYCLAMRLDEGLLFLSDTRTNAGVDNVSTYRKLHVFRPDPDRLFVIQSAGNLATTQEVLDRLTVDLTGPDESLASVDHLFEAALYLGRRSTEAARASSPATSPCSPPTTRRARRPRPARAHHDPLGGRSGLCRVRSGGGTSASSRFPGARRALLS